MSCQPTAGAPQPGSKRGTATSVGLTWVGFTGIARRRDKSAPQEQHPLRRTVDTHQARTAKQISRGIKGNPPPGSPLMLNATPQPVGNSKFACAGGKRKTREGAFLSWRISLRGRAARRRATAIASQSVIYMGFSFRGAERSGASERETSGREGATAARRRLPACANNTN